MNPRSIRCSLLLAAALLVVVADASAVQPHPLFSDGVVLQQAIPVPVWGTGADGETITVTFAGQTVSTTVADGRWRVRLDPLKADATPRALVIAGANTVTITNVLVGEVWVCSGQSNMEWRLARAETGPAAAKEATDDGLRFFVVPNKPAGEPQATVQATWQASTPETALRFSGVGYFFGRDLRVARQVPVGLIQADWGGTPAEAWTDRAVLAADPELRSIAANYETAAAGHAQALEQFNQKKDELLARWEQQVAEAKEKKSRPPRKPAPPVHPRESAHQAGTLYNGMIAPLQPFAIRGVIWYQGESNNGRAAQYTHLFATMIQSWRKAWGQGNFPFLFVQIAPFKGMSPEIREAQWLTLKRVPNTAMAVTVDVGNANDIHPTQKEPVGQRLALAARALAYGDSIEYSGPLYDSMVVAGNKAILRFTHTGSGLEARGGDLKGFTVAGADGQFVEAHAVIDGDTVVVSSPAVATPVAVRYGWANVPDVSLFNKEGLPASPFRTDQP